MDNRIRLYQWLLLPHQGLREARQTQVVLIFENNAEFPRLGHQPEIRMAKGHVPTCGTEDRS
jgi:hypothetical protein